jgi:hypothetical protein
MPPEATKWEMAAFASRGLTPYPDVYPRNPGIYQAGANMILRPIPGCYPGTGPLGTKVAGQVLGICGNHVRALVKPIF